MKKCGMIKKDEEGMNELSIVAMFDDICRNSRTLSVGIEAGFFKILFILKFRTLLKLTYQICRVYSVCGRH